MGGEEGLFDVEAVLEEHEGGLRVGFWEGWGDEGGGGGGDVGDVFCGEEDEVVWGEGFLGDVGDGVAD